MCQELAIQAFKRRGYLTSRMLAKELEISLSTATNNITRLNKQKILKSVETREPLINDKGHKMRVRRVYYYLAPDQW